MAQCFKVLKIKPAAIKIERRAAFGRNYFLYLGYTNNGWWINAARKSPLASHSKGVNSFASLM